MRIFLVRHGQTDFNVQRRNMGQRFDISLNEAGVNQAMKLAETIDTDFDVILSSSLKRATETAKIISDKLNIAYEVRDELMERDTGYLAGNTWDDIAEKFHVTQTDLDKQLITDFSPYGGESAEQVISRLKKIIEEVKLNYKDKKVLVVTHQGILRSLHKMFKSGEYTRLDNAQVIELEI